MAIQRCNGPRGRHPWCGSDSIGTPCRGEWRRLATASRTSSDAAASTVGVSGQAGVLAVWRVAEIWLVPVRVSGRAPRWGGRKGCAAW